MGAGAVLGLATTLWRDAQELRAAEPRDASFELDGIRHRAAIYGSGPACPGVLILHTALGLTLHERALAHRLERSGLTAMTVRYSRRTTGDIARDEEACQRIERVCRTALARLGSDRAVQPGRLAILGLSLGGHFAIRLAASDGHLSPASVATWYGVFPGSLAYVRRLRARLLIVQGARDSDSFVEAARNAAALSPDRVELLLSPELMHQFDVFQPFALGTRIAWQRTVEFLREPIRTDAETGARHGGTVDEHDGRGAA